jgi:DNA polymerase-3 subunit delta'
MWARLQAGRRAGRLAHALVLHGAAGLGKRSFAEAFAASVLCRHGDANGVPCGLCGECQLLAAGTHPDITRVEIPEDKKEIGVDRIRELRDIVTLRSHRAGFKIIIIDPADAMNVNACNALLKTLEEPSGDSLLMLVATRIGALLPTVRSRCQSIAFPTPPRADAEAWLRGVLAAPDDAPALLALADGAPLRARYFAEQNALTAAGNVVRDLEAVATGAAHPAAVAENWLKSDIPTTLSWVGGVVGDLVRLKFEGSPSLINNVSRTSALPELVRRIDARRLFEMLDRVREAQRDAGTSLNQQMVLEGMLLLWNERFSTMNDRVQS